MERSEENRIGRIVVDASVKLHQRMGPGLLESVYEEILCYELGKRGLACERQVPISISYESLEVANAFIADVVVNQKVILELKSVETVNKVHYKQLLTYLRLSGLRLGFLLNFGAAYMKDGMKRVANNLDETPLAS